MQASENKYKFTDVISWDFYWGILNHLNTISVNLIAIKKK